MATFFNQKLLASYGNHDMYKLVSDGEWTIDRQHEIVSSIYDDSNANGVRDEGDLFGFATLEVLGPDPYWSAFDIAILERVDGAFVANIDHEKTATAIEKVNALFHDNTGTYVCMNASDDPYYYFVMEDFASSNYVFMTHFIVSVENEALISMEDNYGIIPMPKYDTDQEGYFSYTHDQMSVIGIPGTVSEEKLEMIGTVIEELSAYSYNYTRDVYYEIALKGRYMRDEASRKMLDIIVDNIKLDPAWIFAKITDNFPQNFRALIRTNNNNWASTYRAKGVILDRAIKRLNGTN